MEIHFNVDRIIKIIFIEKKEEKTMKWVEPKPIKKFFGLYNTGRFTEGHFEDTSSLIRSKYTLEHLRVFGWVIEGKKAYSRPRVEVSLDNSHLVSQSFSSDEEAQEWVRKLKKKSGKNFETFKC